MLEKIKYNFWLLVFIGITLFFLFFLYQAIAFTSVYAYRWVFFLAAPFFTSGIHLLIKSRSVKAEWLSIFNFSLAAGLIAYFHTSSDGLESRWPIMVIPIFNQLYINLFDVIWTNNYALKKMSVGLLSILWISTIICICTDFAYLSNWILPFSVGTGILIFATLFFKKKDKYNSYR